MASLTGGARLGTTGVSSLLKSAMTIQNEVNTYHDAIAAQEYALSAKTADDLAKYQSYLEGRISTLNSSGSVTDATKAVSMSNTLTSAIKANGSADIQRENIQIMAGNASLTDKQTLVGQQFLRAQSIGDMALAQQLESQYYSISQTIQYQAQQAGEAAATLAKANASTDARVAGDMADKALSSLKQFNKDLATAGPKEQNKAIDSWLNTPSPDYGGKTPLKAFADMGISLPKGAKPNAADLAQGVAQYAYQQYAIASKAVDPYLNPGQNNTFEDKANAIILGSTKIPIVGGKTVAYAALPALSQAISSGAVGYNETTGGFGKLKAADIPVPDGTTFNGYRYDTKTNSVQPILSNNGFQAASPDLAIEANALGLNTAAKTNKDSLSQGAAAQVTSNSPDWLRKIVPVGSYLNVALNNNGQLTFSATTTTGTPGNAVYTIIKDASGKRAIAESDGTGDRILPGEYGFNPNSLNPKSQNTYGQNGSHMLPNGKVDQMAGIFQNPNNLIANAGIAQNQAAIAKAAAAMLTATPLPLPNISIAPSVAPAPVAQPTGRTSQLVPMTINPQKPTVNPQQPSNGNLQGGSINLQGGGGGIRL